MSGGGGGGVADEMLAGEGRMGEGSGAGCLSALLILYCLSLICSSLNLICSSDS